MKLEDLRLHTEKSEQLRQEFAELWREELRPAAVALECRDLGVIEHIAWKAFKRARKYWQRQGCPNVVFSDWPEKARSQCDKPSESQ